MNQLRKLAGILWFALGAYACYYLLVTLSIPKFGTGKPEDLIPAIIYTFILVPLIGGSLFIFGKYALSGEYNRED